MSINYLFENIFDLRTKKVVSTRHQIDYKLYKYYIIIPIHCETPYNGNKCTKFQTYPHVEISQNSASPIWTFFQYVNIAASILLCFSICLHRLHFFAFSFYCCHLLFPCHRFHIHIAITISSFGQIVALALVH